METPLLFLTVIETVKIAGQRIMPNAKETIMRKHFFQGFPITPKGDNNQLLRNHFQIKPLRQINQQYLLSSYTHSFDVTD